MKTSARTPSKQLRVVLAPMNIANMPLQIVRGLRAKGHIANQVHYHGGKGHAFKFDLDDAPNIKELGGRISTHIKTLRKYIEADYDIYHFWNKTLFFEPYYKSLTGFDVPLIKARNKRIVHRFTGFDLRLPSLDLKANPFSPFKYGYKHLFDEKLQRSYIDFLAEYVDSFVVQDPEMLQFAPKGTVILPRALNLNDWQMIGIDNNACPLVVHAPSNPEVKGTKFVLKAVEELFSEGLQFEFKLVERMSHAEATMWYKKSDIIIDQLLIGATGVLTLEALALGKPCIVNLRQDLFEDFYKTSSLPIANANPDNIKSVLRNLIKDQHMRDDLSIRGRALVEQFHDVSKVIDQYEDLYLKLMSRSPSRPIGTADLDYLECQAYLSEKNYILNDTIELRPSLVDHYYGQINQTAVSSYTNAGRLKDYEELEKNTRSAINQCNHNQLIVGCSVVIFAFDDLISLDELISSIVDGCLHKKIEILVFCKDAIGAVRLIKKYLKKCKIFVFFADSVTHRNFRSKVIYSNTLLLEFPLSYSYEEISSLINS